VRIQPVKTGLTFHGLRHSHKTWMIADAVPEITQSARLGHTLDDKIQKVYSHIANEVKHRHKSGRVVGGDAGHSQVTGRDRPHGGIDSRPPGK